MEQPTQFSAKPLSPQGNYGDKYQVCRSRILHLSNSAEILPKVASEKEQEAASVNTADYQMFQTVKLIAFSASGDWRSSSIFQSPVTVDSAFLSVA